MSWEQRNHDFSTAQVDAQVAYIEAEREVKRLQDENESLRKELAVTNPLFETLNDANDRLIYENMKLRELVRRMFYAVHPADRDKFLTNVVELGVEV